MAVSPGPGFWLQALRREIAQTQELVVDAAPEVLRAPVQSCPDWDLAGLLAHLGEIYDFASAAVAMPSTERPTPAGRAPASGEPGEAVAFYRERSDHLLRQLANTDPQAPAWNWSSAPNHAEFWFRRMAHESAIHRWDAQLSRGTPEPIEPSLAADGVAEVLDHWVARNAQRAPLPAGVVRLCATDTGHEWSLRLREVGLSQLDTDTVLDPGPGAQARVDAHASDLDLALWGRISFDVLDSQGDAALLRSLQVG